MIPSHHPSIHAALPRTLLVPFKFPPVLPPVAAISAGRAQVTLLHDSKNPAGQQALLQGESWKSCSCAERLAESEEGGCGKEPRQEAHLQHSAAAQEVLQLRALTVRAAGSLCSHSSSCQSRSCPSSPWSPGNGAQVPRGARLGNAARPSTSVSPYSFLVTSPYSPLPNPVSRNPTAQPSVRASHCLPLRNTPTH